ncbi:collagen-like protein [Streptomyces sp. NPDC058045]|uniref:collagen-like protein n=1 Tax=Streptomyces sp. NPDC058045 TaxID=3346311 RepID=UPI0036E6CC72
MTTHAQPSLLARRWRSLMLAAVLLVLSGAVLLVWLRISAEARRADQLAAEAARRGTAVSTLAGDVRTLRAQVRDQGGTPAVPDPARAVADLPDRVDAVPGTLGERGPAGPQGPRGEAGAHGHNGADGDTGAPGRAGDTVTGPPGAPGQAGESITGSPGPAGADGKDGRDGKDGAPGPTCPDGYTLHPPPGDPDGLMCRRDSAPPPDPDPTSSPPAVLLDRRRS